MISRGIFEQIIFFVQSSRRKEKYGRDFGRFIYIYIYIFAMNTNETRKKLTEWSGIDGSRGCTHGEKHLCDKWFQCVGVKGKYVRNRYVRVIESGIARLLVLPLRIYWLPFYIRSCHRQYEARQLLSREFGEPYKNVLICPDTPFGHETK